MASPQKEHGFTPIAHELFVAILAYPFCTYELKILLYILVETYGRQRKKTQISYGGIARHVNCSRRNVIKVYQKLEAENIVFAQETKNKRKANIMGINKDYQKWKRWSYGYLVDKFGNLVNAQTLSGERSDTMGVNPHTLSKRPTGEPSHTMSGEPSHTTTKNRRTGTEEAGRREQAASKKISRILKGYEDHIKKKTSVLVDRFFMNDFKDEVRVWASIIQARDKRNPAGYLVKILANPKYTVADSCHEQAKKEMRDCGR